MRPRLCARFTASARLRTPSFRYTPLVYSLTVCGERKSSSAISRLVDPEAIRLTTSRSRSDSAVLAGSGSGSNTSMPSPTMRIARRTSGAPQPLDTNPEAPAGPPPAWNTNPPAPPARASAGEIRPAPEIRRILVPGETARSSSQISAPDWCPRKRSTSATCGLVSRATWSASSASRAARQRSTHGWRSSSSRKPHWTTSWSSTTRTRIWRPSLESISVIAQRDEEANVPAIRRQGPELDDAAVLERLQRGHAQPKARSHARRPRPVVHDLQGERVVGAIDADRDAAGLRVLVGISERLQQDRLRQRLDVLRDLHPVLPVDGEAVLIGGDAVDDLPHARPPAPGRRREGAAQRRAQLLEHSAQLLVR